MSLTGTPFTASRMRSRNAADRSSEAPATTKMTAFTTSLASCRLGTKPALNAASARGKFADPRISVRSKSKKAADGAN